MQEFNIGKFLILPTILVPTASVFSNTLDSEQRVSMEPSLNTYQKETYSIFTDYVLSHYSSYLPPESEFQKSIENAKYRYKIVNNHDYNFDEGGNKFIKVLYQLNPFSSSKIYFRDDSIKAVFDYQGNKVSMKYDYDCPDVVFISCFEDVVSLKVREYDIDSINNLVEFFNA